MANQSIREYLVKFNAGEYDSPMVRTQIAAGWHDWFCRETSLRNKTYALTQKLKMILSSDKIDQDKMYVFFKNICPCYGSLYDDFRICDIETGDVIYTVVPASGFDATKGRAEVYGKENEFKKPLAKGSWKDVKKFFLEAK